MEKSIRGYTITREMPASSAQLYAAEKGGRPYVLKEFMRYRFPADEGEPCPPVLAGAERRTQAYYDAISRAAEYIRRHIRGDGLMNVPLEVFRDGKKIYLATRLIDDCGLTTEELHRVLTPEQMNVLLKSILMQLDALGGIGFIHGDIKPENVVISRRNQHFVGSIIDFDTGYIAREGPGEFVDHTPEYASPELLRLEMLMDRPESDPARREAVRRVTCDADVFAMACVFCHILTGSAWMAKDVNGDPVPPGRQLLAGYAASLPQLHPVWRTLLGRMTAADPSSRMSPGDAVECLNAALASGVYDEMNDPLNRLRRYRPNGGELPDTARLKTADDVRHGGQAIISPAEGCWQLPDRMKNGGCAARALRKRHKRNLDELRRTAATIGRMKGLTGAVTPFTIVKRRGVVCTAQRLPAGRVTALKRLHETAGIGQIDDAMRKLLTDMHRCHEAGLVHGTIAPDSVWAVQRDGQISLVLADACRMRGADDLPHGCGTDADAGLMAPEMHRYVTAADGKFASALRGMIGGSADLFSLGLLYHLMLTGEWPRITDGTCTCFAMAAERGSISLSDALDEDRARIIRQMIAFEPGERPASCREAARMMKDAAVPEERRDGLSTIAAARRRRV